jgi:hypothetical protein
MIGIIHFQDIWQFQMSDRNSHNYRPLNTPISQEANNRVEPYRKTMQ